jgi:DNA-binding transcriptional LysR family regulator
MTAAAEKLHIAQPSVSQAIAELEKHYNLKLFERLGRKLFITAAGQKLLSYARHILNLSNEAEAAMQEIFEQGLVRVGASVTIGNCIFHRLIRNFIKDNPHTKIAPSVNNTRIIENMLLLDQLDLGLIEGNVHSQLLVAQPFMKDELVLVTDPNHPFAAKGSIAAIELNHVEFLVREEGSGTRELFTSVMASHGISWQTGGVYNSTEAIKDAVATGLAITVISKMSVQNEINRKELAIVAIDDLNFCRQFSLAYHKNKFITPALAKFVQHTLHFAQ